ncbi:hypothetical protein AB0B50_28015 [Streptomyces sp. NPDC041068]|uniref:hypothetical protein n=1 Tax=Streptomyces sp. NPDC041068 TaxID=3155130 RepID=UPI0033F57DB0
MDQEAGRWVGRRMDQGVAVGFLRIAAAERDRVVGQRPSEARLVRLGLDALLADVESPSLAMLAGLGRDELGEARELFDLVVEELGLVPIAEGDPADARWTVARWWAGRIVAGDLDPVRGAGLIHAEAAELGYPAALQTIVDLATEIIVQEEGFVVPQRMSDDIVSATRNHLRDGGHRTGRA